MAESVLTPDNLSKQTYLAPQKRQHIKENIQSLEWALRGRSMFGGMDMPRDIAFPDHNPPEPWIIQDSLDKEQALLSASTPPEASPLDKNKLYRRLKDLDELITHDMPTYEMMEQPTMTNVEHHMAWEKIHKPHILERRSILRILDTDNDSPFFTSVEQLRTATPPKGNPRRFFQSFDYIQFQDAKEEELSVIDDGSYTKFLELKLRNWTEMTICKEMGWPRELYNAAMSRWRKALLDSSYIKFLELQAHHRSAPEIQEILGWTQECYDEAMARWRESVGDAVQEPIIISASQANGMRTAPETSATVPQQTPLTVPDTPWFAPKAEQEVAQTKSAQVGEVLLQRMELLELKVSEVAKMLQVHRLTLGRKLRGKAPLTPEDVVGLTTLMDKIERERGYVDPDAIPLGGDPATTT